MADAAKAIEIQSDTERMEAAISGLEKMRDEMQSKINELEALTEKLEGRADEAEGEVGELEQTISEMEPKVISDSKLRDLAQVRTLIYQGRHDDGRYKLERVLDELDNCWRTFA